MRIIAFCVLLLGSTSGLSQDQNEQTLTTPRALFKVAPQNFALNTLKIGTEVFNKSGTKSYSLYLYGRFDGNHESEPHYYGDDVYKGVGGEFQYRKYVSPMKSYVTRRNKSYLQGIYVSGYVQAASFKQEGDFTYTTYDWNTGMRNTYSFYVDENTANWGTGFTFGLHRTFWSVLFVDAYLGGGIQWSDTIINYTPSQPIPNAYYSSYSGITSPDYQGIMPKFGIQLGILL
ncbi:MAG: hypothetical protein JNM78_06980 [Cyclobacteriaceae bacterium]|nr:hypothetical protein [Cyclobacteriaceae bacterium]